MPFTNVVDIHAHSLLQEISRSARGGQKAQNYGIEGAWILCCGLGILELQAYYKLVTSRPLLPPGFRMQIVTEQSDCSPTIDLLHAPCGAFWAFTAGPIGQKFD